MTYPTGNSEVGTEPRTAQADVTAATRDKPKFTPGPWHVSGRFSASAQGRFNPNTKVAFTSPHGWTEEQQAANACLIAAAPRMFKVLEQLDYWFDADQEVLDAMSHDERRDHTRIHDMIRHTLAEARGQS